MYLYPFKIFAVSKNKRLLKPDGTYGGIYDIEQLNWANATYESIRKDGRVSVLLGKVFNDIKLICMDLDDCIIDGELEPLTKELLNEFNKDEYETSSSGTGLHVYILTKLDLPTFIVKDMDGVKSFECYTNKRHIVTTSFDFKNTSLSVGKHDEFLKSMYKRVEELKNRTSENIQLAKDLFNGKEIKTEQDLNSAVFGRKPVTDMYTLRGIGYKDPNLIEIIDTDPKTVDQSSHDAKLIRKLMYYTLSFESAWTMATKTNYYKNKDEYHKKKFANPSYINRTRKFIEGGTI